MTDKTKKTDITDLLNDAIDAWRGNLYQGLFYQLTRTFAHHRLGEKYDAKMVYDKLLQLVNEAEKFDSEIELFRTALVKDFKEIIKKN